MTLDESPRAPHDESAELLISAAPEFEFDIAIVGLGRVGLSTALGYHAHGAKVLGVDVSADRLISIGAELVELTDADHQRLNSALTDDGFQLTSEAAAINRARTVIVCVPTPVDKYFTPDLTTLRGACASVVQNATPGQLLMLTSTTYVGCTDDLLAGPITQRGLRVGEDVFVAFSAERSDPDSTSVSQDAMPHVVGGATPACEARASDTLSHYAQSVHCVPSLATAEMTKLLENTFRNERIALATELANICLSMKLNMTRAIDAATTKSFGVHAVQTGT